MKTFNEYVQERDARVDEDLRGMARAGWAGAKNLGYNAGAALGNAGMGAFNTPVGAWRAGVGALDGASTGDYRRMQRGGRQLGRGLGQLGKGVAHLVGGVPSSILQGSRAGRQNLPQSNSRCGKFMGLTSQPASSQTETPDTTEENPAAQPPEQNNRYQATMRDNGKMNVLPVYQQLMKDIDGMGPRGVTALNRMKKDIDQRLMKIQSSVDGVS